METFIMVMTFTFVAAGSFAVGFTFGRENKSRWEKDIAELGRVLCEDWQQRWNGHREFLRHQHENEIRHLLRTCLSLSDFPDRCKEYIKKKLEKIKVGT